MDISSDKFKKVSNPSGKNEGQESGTGAELDPRSGAERAVSESVRRSG